MFVGSNYLRAAFLTQTMDACLRLNRENIHIMEAIVMKLIPKYDHLKERTSNVTVKTSRNMQGKLRQRKLFHFI